MACGAEHTVVQTTRGLYSWGNNEYGQLGTGDGKNRTRPAAVENLPSLAVDSLTCGYFHTVAMATEEETIWGWGANSFGQLSLHQNAKVLLPSRLRELERRRACVISAGASHTAFITAQVRSGLALTFPHVLYGPNAGKFVYMW